MSELYLVHHGILGQKWGVRRYQNPDGSLTEEGKKRYGKELLKAASDSRNNYYKKGEYYQHNKVIEKDEYLNNYKKEVMSGDNYKAIKEKADKARKELDIYKKEYESDEDNYFIAAKIKLETQCNDPSIGNLCKEMQGWRWYKYEDWSQNDTSPERVYAASKNLISKIENAKDAVFKEEQYLSDKGKEFFESVVDSSVSTAYSTPGYYAKNFVSTHMKDHLPDSFTFYDVFNDKSDNNIQSNCRYVNAAKKISSTINPDRDSDWEALNEAVEALKLDKKDTRKLTDSDWKKINNYIKTH